MAAHITVTIKTRTTSQTAGNPNIHTHNAEIIPGYFEISEWCRTDVLVFVDTYFYFEGKTSGVLSAALMKMKSS